jgi:hypothetical protein
MLAAAGTMDDCDSTHGLRIGVKKEKPVMEKIARIYFVLVKFSGTTNKRTRAQSVCMVSDHTMLHVTHDPHSEKRREK